MASGNSDIVTHDDMAVELPPAAARKGGRPSLTRGLSTKSMMYDVDGDGKLSPLEQVSRSFCLLPRVCRIGTTNP